MTMTTTNITSLSDIKPAIARSISHNEIVKLEVEDPKAALDAIDNDENVTELNWTDTNTPGELDVWGKRMGEDFRLRITAA